MAGPVARASIVTTATGNSTGIIFTPFRRKGGAPQARGEGARTQDHPPRSPFLWKGEENQAQVSGFTLIEMLAVIVLIAIGVTLTAVALRGRSRGDLQAAAQQVAAGLRNTRTRAMATGQPQWFSVDLRAHTFAAPGRTPRSLPSGTTLEVTSAASAATPGSVARIGYFPDGSSSGGDITLDRDRRTVRVDVDWLTGAVTVANGAAP